MQTQDNLQPKNVPESNISETDKVGSPRKSKRFLVITVLSIVLLIFLGLVVQHLTGFGLNREKGSNQGSDGNVETSNYPTDENCNSSTTPVLSQEFTDLSKINAINPIGGLGGGSPGRSYIGVVKEAETTIYSPTDMVLENVIYAKRPVNPLYSMQAGEKGEYGLYFRLSCNVTILFDHIDRVSDKILAVAPEKPSETSRVENPPVNLKISKGELLGYTDGTSQAHTFDFLLIDRSKPATYLNPKRWEWEQAIYAQCPYDYFTPELREKYYAKIGEVIEKSTGLEFIPTGSCGYLSHDITATISGGWFKGESTDIKGDYLAIARATVSPKRVDLVTRKEGLMGPDSVLHDYTPKVFPEEVKVGQEVCFHDQNTSKWAFVRLESTTTLSLARGVGSCPASFPQQQSEVWER